ncbi:MAG: ketoacyl-ACP synthase III [Candidatus Delongbacteria bacterium]|nr:ketoacyl-ACP synthase III [Candidatus Cloacimonadota bacterium]MCB9473332.1 ketoacyl-ACP synthase III [Candidatus Delongbacteria bacterium]
MITRSRILGTGFQTGPTLLTNDDLAKKVDTSDEWIFSRTGIRQRYIVSPEDGVVTSDLCADAGRKALEAAGLEATDLDLILVGTVTGDCKFPATGVFVQAKLGASNAAAMDLSAACSGFVYGLELADAMIRCGVKKHALVIGGEVLTSMIDWNDRTTCVLFGDAAGAVVLGPSTNDTGVLATYSKSNGDLAELLWTPGCGSLRRLSPESLEAGDHTVKMNGRKVYTNAVACMADSVEQVLARAGMTPDQIDLLVPHQANIRIIEATCERFGFPLERTKINVDRFGNTSAASIPIALDEAIREGRVGPGSTCLMTVFGGGFTWSSAIVRL